MRFNSGVSVPIAGRDGRAYGVIGAHTARRRRFGDPAAVAADREEDGAAQANVAQDVGERVVVHSVRSGVSVRLAGRSVKVRERAPAMADGRASRHDAGSCARRDGAEE